LKWSINSFTNPYFVYSHAPKYVVLCSQKSVTKCPIPMKLKKCFFIEIVSSTDAVLVQFQAVIEISPGQDLVGFRQIHTYTSL
jgi:hypothetical protein